MMLQNMRCGHTLVYVCFYVYKFVECYNELLKKCTCLCMGVCMCLRSEFLSACEYMCVNIIGCMDMCVYMCGYLFVYV